MLTTQNQQFTHFYKQFTNIFLRVARFYKHFLFVFLSFTRFYKHFFMSKHIKDNVYATI